jgi:uncharacterized protein (DUF1800 family)
LNRDAQFETEAVLDHYIFHPNTAPFVSLRFIQRFGISNPSPAFLKDVSTAFTTGVYHYASTPDSRSFGSGEYGDLAATIAAIILNRESQEVSLDADAMYGSLREPLIKLISLMRNLEYKQYWTSSGRYFPSLYLLETKIGKENDINLLIAFIYTLTHSLLLLHFRSNGL